MKLKKILKEQMDLEEAVQRADSLFKSGKVFQPQKPFLRGTDTNYGLVGSREVRKNRAPLSTHLYMDAILEGIRRHSYPEFPNRRNATFATTIYSAATPYGNNIYAVFPEKNSKIYVAPDDTYVYTEAPKGLWDLFKRLFPKYYKAVDRHVYELEEVMENRYPNIWKLMDLLPKAVKKLSKKKLAKGKATSSQEDRAIENIFTQGYGEIKKEVKSLEKYLDELMKNLGSDDERITDELWLSDIYLRFHKFVVGLRDIINKLERYFDNVTPYQPSDKDYEEIIIETDKIWLISGELLTEYFEYDSSRQKWKRIK